MRGHRFCIAIAAAATLLVPATPAFADDSTATFDVTAGVLAISVPASATIGGAAPGNAISGALGTVTVDDERAALNAAWIVSVTATDFTTGGATAAETIATTAVSYWSGAATADTGTGTFAPGQADADARQSLDASRTAFAYTAGAGNNTASWNPTLVINVPAGNVAGTYTGTVTHSVV